MANTTTAILIPSLNRPHKLQTLIENIRQVTPEPHKIYCMVSDDESAKILDDLGVNFWRDKGDVRYVTRMNFMYRHTEEPFIFTGSDDVYFHEQWLKNALEAMEDGIDLVVVNDGLNPNGTEALVRRKYVQNQSCCMDVPDVLFYPDYHHNFADTEQFETAKKRGVYCYADKSFVEHLHWNNHKNEHDETYKLSDQNVIEDMNLYKSRRHLWQ